MIGVGDMAVDEPVDAVGVTGDERVERGEIPRVDDATHESPVVIRIGAAHGTLLWTRRASAGSPAEGRPPRGVAEKPRDDAVSSPPPPRESPAGAAIMPLPKDLAPADAAAALKADPGLSYVDVRSSAEFAGGHPPRAINVPLAEFDPRRGMIPNPRFLEVMGAAFPKDRPLIVGCASGGRSKQAQHLLTQVGFADVANLAGGMQGGVGPAGPVPGWIGSGLPVAKDGRTYADVLRSLAP